MPTLEAHIHIAEDGTLTGRVPPGTPAGDHEATILIRDWAVAPKGLNLADMPSHVEPWDGSISLRREDMYRDNGR
jgi:hypothetical protein